MFFYNQMNYSNIDYSYNGNGKTVKTSGCGVCSALMVLNNLYEKEVMSVAQMAQFSKKAGARASGGTDMNALLKALCKNYTISYKTTSKNAELLAHLQSGGMAILNQGTAYNVFSTAGHYVVAYAIATGETIRCLDPQLYDGKYSGIPRKDRIVKTTGNEIWVSLTQIGKATIDRSPSYYLVSFTGKPVAFKSFTGYVTASTLNVRAGAGTGYKVVGTLAKDKAVKIIGQNGTWYKIANGYVSATYINKSAPKTTGTVTASTLNVRKGAGIGYKVLGTLKKRKTVTITGESGNWYKISYNNGTGYISKKYIKK